MPLWFRMFGSRGAVLSLPLAAAACGPDMGQIALCEQVVHQLVGPPGAIEITDWRDDDAGPHTIAAVYRRPQPSTESGPERKLVCAFAGGGTGEARLHLTGVVLEDGSELSRMPLAYLKLQLGLR